ncbi:hypothetical protein FPSE_03634 [Fusarium pseudograminearum CS3096]|uniref:Uncharacterized protein n=1 Tax=Fusarium pseudograminearum (strain CS3096) TaxID=1028729 RepID=K3VN28_FUSPC|nr:hypothetical protein FPSE_03634 [Fusarium pseudograminearum CS3096]EKJ76159.1 hypothetical protein FPSE_03634 [Fusarium pseudograminearum CS3096]
MSCLSESAGYFGPSSVLIQGRGKYRHHFSYIILLMSDPCNHRNENATGNDGLSGLPDTTQKPEVPVRSGRVSAIAMTVRSVSKKSIPHPCVL